jgi:F0F1-type ATP synthase assembly protein I
LDLSQRSDLTQSVHRSSGSFELVLGAVIFGLIGLLIDRALGITPVLTVVFTVGGLIGAVISVYTRYRNQMAELGAQRS